MQRRFAVIFLVVLLGAFLLGTAFAHHGGEDEQPCESGQAGDYNKHCDDDQDGIPNRSDDCRDTYDPSNTCAAQGPLGPGNPNGPDGFGGDCTPAVHQEVPGQPPVDYNPNTDLNDNGSDEVCQAQHEVEGWEALLLSAGDPDGDGQVLDNCPTDPNPCEPPPPDSDGDHIPDSIDDDSDGDHIPDGIDDDPESNLDPDTYEGYVHQAIDDLQGAASDAIDGVQEEVDNNQTINDVKQTVKDIIDEL